MMFVKTKVKMLMIVVKMAPGMMRKRWQLSELAPQPFPQLGLQHFTPPSKIDQHYKTHVVERDDKKSLFLLLFDMFLLKAKIMIKNPADN